MRDGFGREGVGYGNVHDGIGIAWSIIEGGQYMETMTDYEKQAQEFLKSVRGDVKVEFLEYGKHFDDDKEARNVYRFTIKRGGKSYSGRFGQSIVATNAGNEPTVSDILSCLTKNDPGTFDEFCSEFGYDTDSRRAEKTYKAVVKEWAGVDRVFGDVLSALGEIQ